MSLQFPLSILRLKKNIKTNKAKYMWWIIGIIIIWFVLIKPLIKFLAHQKRNNATAFSMLNDEVKMLILNEDIIQLATIVTACELEGDYRTCNIILDACSHRGLSLATRVDRVRNELRIKAGLGPLKKI